VVEQEALIIDPNSRADRRGGPVRAQQRQGQSAPAPAQTAAPPPAPAQAAAPPPERKKLDLTRDQREIQRRQASVTARPTRTSHVIIEERRTTTGAGPREPRVEGGPPVEVYRDGPPMRDDRPHGLRDLPLIGPLFGPPARGLIAHEPALPKHRHG